MPELPEVEVLVRHLEPLLCGRRVKSTVVLRQKSIRPTTPNELEAALASARFKTVERRGKYLLFTLEKRGRPVQVLGHLGMTGRMYAIPSRSSPPKHSAVMLELDRGRFIFEDIRYFGRFTLDTSALEQLGPEPLGDDFTTEYFQDALKRSRQPIKIRLLDQTLVAGVGNIYACEALYRAGISPRLAACRLKKSQIDRLLRTIREVLSEAIAFGSTVPLDWHGAGAGEGLFYYGRAPGTPDYYEEKLAVYGRENRPCTLCGRLIRRVVQGGRGTYFCPGCQRQSQSGP